MITKQMPIFMAKSPQALFPLKFAVVSVRNVSLMFLSVHNISRHPPEVLSSSKNQASSGIPGVSPPAERSEGNSFRFVDIA